MKENLHYKTRLKSLAAQRRRRCLSPGAITIMLVALALIGFTGEKVAAQTSTFSYTGGVQTYTVATTGTVAIDITGAKGASHEYVSGNGGNGGRVVCTLAVTAGQVLNIYVGGQGGTTGGGFNGGGNGACYYYGGYCGGGGGGASDIRIGGTSLSDRVIVAGGGGGGGYYCGGGGGGGTTGLTDACSASGGGSQSSGGAGGSGGASGTLGSGGSASLYDGYAGGGGGGYYGGGGGNYGYGGGGGSSYTSASGISGVTHSQGYQNGNGYVYITPLCSPGVTVTASGYICRGSSMGLTASGSTGYTWSPATGLSATTGASVTASPTTTTTYTVTESTNGCNNTVTVGVSTVPTVTASASTAICSGGSTGISASGAGIYAWSPGTGLSATTGASITASPSGTTTYTVTGTNPGSSSLLYSQYFDGSYPGGTGTAQYAAWTSYVASLSGAYSYTSLTIRGTNDMTGITCTDPTVILGLANALRTGSSYSAYANGHTWFVGNCSGQEFGLDYPCSCSASYVFRTMYYAPYVGGANVASCSGTTQQLEIEFVYTTGTTCSSTATTTVSVNSNPPVSTGETFTCVGGNITLSNAVSGGSWSSSNPSVATVGSSSGVVTGVATGSVNITYALGTGCYSVKTIDVNPPIPSITGTTNVCIGTTTDLDDSMAGGTWSTSSSYFGSVDPTTGVVTGIHPGGYTTVTYSINSGCNTSTSVYTSNIVLSIAGSLTTCVGSISTLSVPGYPGATWVTPDSATAYINATSGAMLGIAAGTVPVTVNYGYCFTTGVATVNPVPASITGGSEVCMGSTLALACSTGGGAWSSSNTAKATVDGSGTVTGVSSGTATISYALGTGCAATKVVTVGGMPAAISGTTTLCEGATTTLSCTSTGGTWSSSATGTADVTSTVVTGVASYALISGIAAGGATISYSYPGGCVQTVNVTVAAPPASIGGTLDICVGGTSTLTGGGGGTWSSSTTTVASIGSSTGIATGSSAGTSTITYRTSATCYTTSVVTVSVPAAISGAASVCKTYTTTFTHAVGGGTWSSSNAAVASVDASGVVTGVLAGSATITYNISTGCYAVKTIYVYNNPTAITGTASVCAGSNTTLTGATGTTAVWSSSNGSVATVGSSSGVVTGVAAGNADITFTATATGCFSTRNVTVNEAPTAITGASTLCVGADETYMSTPTGGAWASTSPTVGSINGTTGTATGRAAGGTYIKYTLSNGCYVLKAVTVTALPGGITGTSIVCVGNSVVLTAASSGSTWSTSAAGTASITATTASTATVAGISAGVATISYSNAAGCSRTYAVTVNAAVADITGDDIVCSTGTITLTDATAGGTWSSNATTKVSVATYTGIATGGATLGTAVITYKVGAGCYTTKSITNNAALPNILGGASYMCSGADAAVTLTNAVSGGTWSSSNTSVAVVDGTTGVVTGVLMGGSNTYVYITYATSAGCTKSRAILIKPQPIITGAEEVSVGATTTMTGSPTGGSWGSSSTAIAYISGYGVVYGIGAGSATITYTLAGCANTKGITVIGTASRPAGMTEEAVTLFSVFPNPSHGSLSVSTGVAGTFTIYTVDGKVAATSELTEGVNAINMPANMAAGTYLCRFNGVDGSVQAVRLVYEP